MNRFLYGLVMMLSVVPTAMAQSETTRQTVSPHLSRITSDTCLLAGQRIRLVGEALGSERRYQLVLITGSTQAVLKVEQWSDNAITAFIPTLPDLSGDYGTLVIRDRQSGGMVSNSLTVRFCPKVDVNTSSSSRPSQEPTNRPPRRSDSIATPGMSVPQENTSPLAAGRGSEDIEPQEVIILSRDMAAARRLDDNVKQLGYRIKRRRALKQIGMVLSVIRLPDGVAVNEAVQQLQRLGRKLIIDANHRYRLMGAVNDQVKPAHQLIKWGKITPHCGKGIRLGLIDTQVDSRHPALPANHIVSRSFLPLGVKAADKGHATAIASILIGRPGRNESIAGLLPGAELYSAGIFRQRADDNIDTTAELIIAALDWLRGQRVSVINLSLTGKPNRLLQQVIRQLVKQNQLLAAAAGNGGPDAPPAYPAAWPGVIAVTAVDVQARIYRHANRGNYIDLAAPGVDVWAARSGSKGAYHTGTSFAVPYATAALAVLRRREGGWGNDRLLQQLRQQVRDLGAPGQDPIYGYGLLQMHDGGCA